MAAYLHAVDPYIGLPVDSAEVQYHISTLPCRRHGEVPLIPQGIFGAHLLADTGQGGFGTERHEYLALKLRRLL